MTLKQIFFEARKCYHGILYLSTFAKVLPNPWPLSSSFLTSSQFDHAPDSYFQYSELGLHLTFLQNMAT